MTFFTQHSPARAPTARQLTPPLTPSPTRRRSFTPRASPALRFTAGHILWDLDNLRPYSLADLDALASLIAAAVTDLTPAPGPPLGLTAFANPTTAAYLGGIKALEKAVKGSVVLTTARKQSVDLEMKGAMVAMVKQHRLIDHQVLIACVTDDTDFVGALRYCGELGAATVAVGRHGSGRRPQWAAPRRLDSLALPAAAAAAVALRKPAAPGEAWTVEQRWLNPAMTSSSVLRLSLPL